MTEFNTTNICFKKETNLGLSALRLHLYAMNFSKTGFSLLRG